MNDFSAFRIIAAIALVTASCALFASLPGCGQNSPGEPPHVSSQLGSVPANGLGHAQHLSDEAQVVCADDSRCPENVGMIVAATEAGVTRCSGALIGPDLVVTSGSCIPSALSQEKGGSPSCAELVRFLLPALNNGNVPAQEGRCGEILGGGSPSSPYVFIRLVAPVTGRHPLALDVSGLQDGASFSVPVVNPTSDSKPLGEVRVLNCKAYQKTAVLPQFAGDLSPVAALGGCLVGATADGAPVLDDRGAMRAVIQSGTSPRDIQNDQLVFGPMLPNTQIADFAFAANAACMQIPGASPRALSPSCALDAKIITPDGALARAVTPLVLAAAQAALAPRLARWQASAAAAKFGWALAPLTASPAQQAEPLPACFSKPTGWLSAYNHWYTRGGYATDAEMDLPIPRWRVEFALSAVLQTTYSIVDAGSDSVRLHFNPKDLAQSGQSSVTLTSSSTGEAIGEARVLKTCGR